jgi:predicted MPP superfamily phosphohydrolase
VTPSFLRPRGRGTNYSRLRGAAEALLHHAYRGDWPARAWSRAPGAAAVRRVEVALDLGLAAPLTVAFASDLHLGPTTSPRTLDRAFAHLAEARADVLALGGDYVFLEATREKARELRARVEAIPARAKVAVLGNHDLWTHHPLLEDALREAGVAVLVNDAVRLPPPHDDVALVGLDDPWTGAPDADRAVGAAGDARVRIGLCHSPDGLPFLAGKGVPLLLVGHTHGGQIALPGPRPIIVPGPMGQRYPFGRHRVGEVHLVVSRGVGATELPIRAFAPPDVVVARIR